MGTDSNGYMGNILRVDLTTGKVGVESLPEDLAKQYIGGRGIGTKILYDELKPGIAPLSPENKLVYANGPLTGSIAPLVYLATARPVQGTADLHADTA